VKALLLIPLGISLITVLACAQGTDLLELRGVVLEIGPNAPLAGAQVTVYQFDRVRVKTVFASIITDSSGAFQFKPTVAGDYYVEASKPDYFAAGELPGANTSPQSSTGALANLNRDHPSEDFRLALMRLGELKGKAVDEDGKPVSQLRVDLIPGTSPTMPALSAPALRSTRSVATAADGSFHVTGLVPGNYVVRVSTWIGAMKHPETDFSAADEDAVDQDFAT
jgi:protocatechuate 3,4-dioxygenase beta subunit